MKIVNFHENNWKLLKSMESTEKLWKVRKVLKSTEKCEKLWNVWFCELLWWKDAFRVDRHDFTCRSTWVSCRSTWFRMSINMFPVSIDMILHVDRHDLHVERHDFGSRSTWFPCRSTCLSMFFHVDQHANRPHLVLLKTAVGASRSGFPVLIGNPV